MPWATLAMLLAQYTLPLVEKLVVNWTNPNPVTTADWDALKALAQQTARTQMLAALARAGIAADSDQGKALLAQVPA